MAGQYYDSESGLFYNGNRVYSPAIGRYISSDLIGIAGGLNTFGYVGDNPLMWIDPLGLYDFNTQQTQQIFLDRAFNDATEGTFAGLWNIYNNSRNGGPLDFFYNNNPRAGDTFCVNGRQLTSGEFANYVAGYETSAYDDYVNGVNVLPFPSRWIAIAYALVDHNIPGLSAQTNDPSDATGRPDIAAGAAALPASGRTPWRLFFGDDSPAQGGGECSCH